MTEQPTSAANSRSLRPEQRRRIVIATAVIPLLCVVTALAVFAAIVAQLPDQIAIHWTASGQADGFGPVWLGPMLLLGIGLVIAAAFTTIVLQGAVRAQSTAYLRWTAGVGTGLVGFLSALMTLSLVIQVGVTDPATAPLPMFPAALWAVLIGAIVGLPSAFLVPRLPAVQRASQRASSVQLAPGERAVWTRTVSAPAGIWVIGLGVTLLSAAAAVVTGVGSGQWWILVVPAILLVIAVPTLRFRATVSPDGLSVHGFPGWPVFRVPLSAVDSVSVPEVSPAGEFGGWGVRLGAGRRWGVILNSGPAIEVTRTDGKRTFVVTVPDADTGAALLSDYRERLTGTAA